MWLGQLELHRPRPRPGAKQSAMHQRVARRIHLIGVARLKQEIVDADVRDRIEEIGQHHRRDAEPAQRREAFQRRAGERQERGPHQEEDHRLAEIRLLHQAGRDQAGHCEADRHHRQRAIMLLERQQPRHRHHIKRLEELRRLHLQQADAQPALRTVHLMADDRGEHQCNDRRRRAQQAEPPRQILGKHRDDEHHRHANREPHALAVEIIERRELHRAVRIADAGGRGGGGHRDQADADQHRHQREQDEIDLPEPAAQRRPIGATEARRLAVANLDLPGRRRRHRVHLHALPPSPATARRKASPRAS